MHDMHQILETFKNEGRIHHAYLITGDIEKNIKKLRSEIEKIVGGDLSSYPDYHFNVAAIFSVNDGRLLIEKQKTKSFGGGGRFFVIAAHSFTPEAQNSLLKVLEDPIAGNHFFILTTTDELLLPTLRSRLAHIQGEELSYGEIEDWCHKFIMADVTSRFVMIEKLLKDGSGDDDDKTQKHKVRDIFSQIEKVFADRIMVGTPSQNQSDAKFLTELLAMKGYLNDTAPSLRLILEYIAFICP